MQRLRGSRLEHVLFEIHTTLRAVKSWPLWDYSEEHDRHCYYKKRAKVKVGEISLLLH